MKPGKHVMIATRQEVPIKTFYKLSLALALLLAACAPALTPQPTVILTGTATATSTETRPDPTVTPALPPTPTPQTNCNDSALFVADVTVADNTHLKPGQAFRKTWQLRNTGTCTWNASYALVFNGGERMGSPDAIPLVETAPGASLDLSVNLAAPAYDGAFTGLYELRNPQGKVIPVGLTKIIWVKVTVGDAVVAQSAPTAAANSVSGTNSASAGPGWTPHPVKNCRPEQGGAYASQLLALINAARATAGLRGLNVNAQLTASAQGHSTDMACHSLLSHSGSDGSSIYDRIVAAGYAPSNWAEIIFASGSPQQAFDWWMNDPPHRESILDPKLSDFGAGYAYLADSEYGSYFTVDFGQP